jgi:Di-sulfide bridge nucleocytoplasmic transport domain
MQRDPAGVGRARVVAETIGEVINSFVEPISWKTLVSGCLFNIILPCILIDPVKGFGLTSLGFLITLINVLFSFYRARVAPIHHPDPHAAPNSSLPGALPYLGPSTPVSSRIAPPFLTPVHHYMTPAGAYAGSPVEWTRTDMPVPGTPTRRKGRAMADGKLGLNGR